MSKTLNGGAQLPYGQTLPSTTDIPDGLAFYKTASDGQGTTGVYIYGYTGGFLSGSPQLTQGWLQIGGAPDQFVKKVGDTMTGQLELPGYLRITQVAGVQRIVMGNQDSTGVNRPSIIEAGNGAVQIGYGNTWVGSGGNLQTFKLVIDGANFGNAGLTYGGVQVWHANNDGSGSGLDADLLDGQDSSYFLNASNITAGILPIARGGTGRGTVVNGGIPWGDNGGISYSAAAAAANMVFLSGNNASPYWAAQSTLSVGFATSANTANSATTAGNSAQLGGVTEDNAIMKRRQRIHTSDGTSLNSSITKAEHGFSYGGSGEPTGPFIHFGGLSSTNDYVAQLAAGYNGGNDFKIRTRNGDASSWNAWRTILTDGNYNSYSPTLAGGGANGTWNINITGNAASANSVPWAGVTGAPTLYYQFSGGTQSPIPTAFPSYSIAGFDALSSTDMPTTYGVGLQAIGPGGVRSMQLLANWDAEEAGPSGLWFRVNDDTSNQNAWGAWSRIWNDKNLTSLSQLSNDVGFVTTGSLDATYVNVTGDTMTGQLIVPTFISQGTVSIGTAGVGRMVVQVGNGSNTGYTEYINAGGTRIGYIGYGSGTTAINYVAENGATTHAFSGAITASGNLTAGSLSTGGALSVSGLSTLSNVNSGSISSTGNISANGSMTGGSLASNSTLSVTGTSTLATVNSGAINSGAISATGNITATAVLSGGSISTPGTLNVFGGSTLANVNATGSLSVGGNFGVTGTSNLAAVNSGNLAVTGSITATGNITAYSSDARLKTNVHVIEDAVAKVKTLGGYSYDWKQDVCAEVGFTPAGEHEHGLLAQEVELVMPDAVAPAPFNGDYKTVRYERLVALLVAGMNEQQAMIDQLKAEVEALKAR